MKLDPVACELGKKQSELDIAEGQPLLYWGTRGSWGELLTQLMKDRFQVTVEHISDITTDEQSSYRKGYNETTANYIDQTFGPGAYQNVLDEVSQYRTEQYQRYLKDQNRPGSG